MRVKICGITNQQDALFAAENGAWALGFNFYPKSLRYLDFNRAKKIIDNLPADVLKIGIFIDTPYDIIQLQMKNLGLDFSQVYEDIACPVAEKQKFILSLNANSISALPAHEILSQYYYILLDAPPPTLKLRRTGPQGLKKQSSINLQNTPGILGGTGRKSNWEVAKYLAQRYSLILAGGLNNNNIIEATNATHPFAVDTASGTESAPGIKDPILIKSFLAITKKL